MSLFAISPVTFNQSQDKQLCVFTWQNWMHKQEGTDLDSCLSPVTKVSSKRADLNVGLEIMKPLEEKHRKMPQRHQSGQGFLVVVLQEPKLIGYKSRTDRRDYIKPQNVCTAKESIHRQALSGRACLQTVCLTRCWSLGYIKNSMNPTESKSTNNPPRKQGIQWEQSTTHKCIEMLQETH